MAGLKRERSLLEEIICFCCWFVKRKGRRTLFPYRVLLPRTVHGMLIRREYWSVGIDIALSRPTRCQIWCVTQPSHTVNLGPISLADIDCIGVFVHEWPSHRIPQPTSAPNCPERGGYSDLLGLTLQFAKYRTFYIRLTD